MSSRKTYAGMGSHSVTRSEFEDGILRDNARHDNRLDNEMRHVEKAKKVVVRGYDKESQMLRQKMAFAAQRKATSYLSHTTPPNGTTGKTTGSGTTVGRNSRLIPDYEYKQYRLKQKNGHDDSAKQKPVEENQKQPTESVSQQPSGSEAVDGQPTANGNAEFDDKSDEIVPMRRTRAPEEFWSNLSAPKHQSSVRSVRERLAKEFNTPKPKSTPRTSSTQVPAVHGTRLVKK